jgi:MFS family permease
VPSTARPVRGAAALRYREYRLLWLGSAASHTGEWAHQVALGWLVLGLTDSAFYVALAGSLRSVPQLLFTLPAGVQADRSDRRAMLGGCQAAAAALALVLGGLAEHAALGLAGGLCLLLSAVVALRLPKVRTL